MIPFSPRLSVAQVRAVSPRTIIGSRIVSPLGSVQTAYFGGAAIPTIAASTVPIAASVPVATTMPIVTGVAASVASQVPYRGETRLEYIPYERKYIDYESRQYYDKVPVERTVIDYKEVKRIDYVPREKQVTDYYAIEHQTSYIPQTIPEKKIQYVPVETITQRVEYFPVQKQVVHYPEQAISLSRRNLVNFIPPAAVSTSALPVARPNSYYTSMSRLPVTDPVVTTTINQTYIPSQTVPIAVSSANYANAYSTAYNYAAGNNGINPEGTAMEFSNKNANSQPNPIRHGSALYQGGGGIDQRMNAQSQYQLGGIASSNGFKNTTYKY